MAKMKPILQWKVIIDIGILHYIYYGDPTARVCAIRSTSRELKSIDVAVGIHLKGVTY